MPRAFTDKKLVLATHNTGKLREIRDLLAPCHVDVISAGELGIPEPEETEDSFIGNARLKARHSMKDTDLPALADDSGLCVQALDGAPGVYSADWAGQPRDFMRAMEQVNRELGDSTNRKACFVCTLVLVWPDGHEEVFEGKSCGTLVWPPRGEKGFGYDPMFQPDGCTLTFGEMPPADKQTLSHRADALKKLLAGCF